MASNEHRPFGDILRRTRLAAELTQEELAERAGLSARAISDLERGVNRTPRRDTVELLAEALELSEEDRTPFTAAVSRARFPNTSAVFNTSNLVLPLQLSSFVGRQREVSVATELLLRSDIRLLTFTGPGGIGKTRLALRVAEGIAGSFAGGVSFVPLSSVRDPSLVASAMAGALGIKETHGQGLSESVKMRLQEMHTLLVLDNFEHLLGASPLLSELLAGCPYLKLLVTSRSVLHVSAEYVYSVPPMATPRPGQPFSLEETIRYETVRLFVERAQAAEADFVLSEDNAQDVAAICGKLDGLPLAIELAAARVTLLPPRAMLARLSSRLGLLTVGASDAPVRQRTLRAAIDWSYDLLDRTEQRLLGRLSVFAGGCALEAAETVCNLGGGLNVLEGIGILVDKSLLRQVGSVSDEPRYRMLETIREYAYEQLVANGEEEPVRRAHADYYLMLAEKAQPEITGQRQYEWLGILDADHDNLRTALRWLIDRGEVERALRLGGALWWFWYIRNHLSEGLRWLTEILSLDSAEATAARGKALNGAGYLSWYRGNFDQAEALFKEGLDLLRGLDDRLNVAIALNGLGRVASYSRRDYAKARALSEEALAIHRDMGNTWGIAQSLYFLGVAAAFGGDYEAADPLLLEARDLFREVGDRDGIADSLGVRGMVELGRGNYSLTHSLVKEAQAIMRDLGDRKGVARTLAVLGDVHLDQGDLDEADSLYKESISAFRNLDDRWWIAWCLEGLVGVAASEGHPIRAARLLGAAQALREAISAPQPQIHKADYERRVSSVRAQLDDPTFAKALERGCVMGLDEAISYALDQNDPHYSVSRR